MVKYTGGSAAYARTMGMRPVPFKRPGRRRTRLTGWKKGVRPRLGMRVRRGAYTATRQKRKLYGNGKKTGENSSMSYARAGRSWMSRYAKFLYKRVQCRQVDAAHSTGRWESNFGQQTCRDVPSLNSTHLGRLKTAAAGGTVDNNIRLFIGHVKRKLFMRNQSNSVAKVTLYDVVFNRQPTNLLFDSPTECWTKGYNDQGLTDQQLEVGNTPFNSPEFRNFFKVVKVTVINMEPGQQHEHTFIHRINRVVDSTSFDHSSMVFYRGLTSFTMPVFHGSLCHESASPNTVSYLPVVMDWSLFNEVHYGWMPQNRPNYAYAATVPKTITDADFMGEADDIDANNIAA